MCALYNEQTKLWTSSNRRHSELTQIPLGDLILNWMSSRGSKLAQINADTGVELTYHELWLNTIRTAQNLMKRGFRPRQKFCFMTSDNDHLIPTVYASICLLCPVVPLHRMLSKDEIARVLIRIKPAAIFCEANLYEKIEEVLSEMEIDVKVFIFDRRIDNLESVEDLMKETGEEETFVPNVCKVEEDIAGIFCSSGSTGTSKFACISYNHSVFTDPARYSSDSVVFSFDSIFWTVGMRTITDCIFSGAVRLISSQTFSPELQLQFIEKYKINVLYSAGFNMVLCIKHDLIREVDLSNVQTIFLYGTKMHSTLVDEMNHYFPNASLSSWYGLTEISKISDEFPNKDCLGTKRLVNDCTVKIIDENGDRCGPNVDGEICVENSNSFLGYYDDPTTTSAAIDDEGFFRTADFGHFDDNGFLFLSDRKKDVLTVFYFDGIVLPSEIEACLISIPDIDEVSVVGVPITDDMYLPAAVILRKPNSNLSERNVFDIAKDKLSNRSGLRGGVYFVESLPKTNNGKIVKGEVKQLAQKLFERALKNDEDIETFLSDIPEEYRKLINQKYNKQ